MQHIGIDCRFAGAHAGLGRYTRELTTHLLKRNDLLTYTLFVLDENEEWIKDIPADRARIVEAPFPHYSFSEQVQFPHALQTSGIDLLFSPHFNVPLYVQVPFIAVIHDLILHRYPNTAGYPKQWAYRLLMKSTVTRSRSLIAVSTFTALELGGLYGGNILKKTDIVGEGVARAFTPQSEAAQQTVREKLGLHSPFFLYVGNAKEHKNVQMLLDAYVASDRGDTEILLVTGGPEADRLKLPHGARLLPGVSDADLPALYSAARAFVTASLYEGYCLPVAEALACGCSVIATDRSAIPKIAGGRALLVEPTVAAFNAALSSATLPRPSGTMPRWEDAAEQVAKILLR